jgi:hypothetical protein
VGSRIAPQLPPLNRRAQRRAFLLNPATRLQPNLLQLAGTGWNGPSRKVFRFLTLGYLLVRAGTHLVGFRSLWARARGGSNPLTRTRLSRLLVLGAGRARLQPDRSLGASC